MHATSIVRALLGVAAAGAPVALAACKGESSTGPGTAYPYDLVFERREGSSGPADLYLHSLRDNSETRILAPNVAGMHPSAAKGSLLAFVRVDAEFTNEIFVISRGANGQFGGLTNVTNSVDADDMMPALSPNGARIAFVTDRDGFADIFVVNVDGTNLRRITPQDPSPAVTTEWWPTWAPDNARIAYSSTLDGTADIWTSTVDATPVLRSRLTGGADIDLHPTWSKDGTQIAFQRTDANTGDTDIMILTVGTGELRRIEMPGQQLWPAWSPEGDLIAFSSNHEGSDFEIYTMDVDGDNVTRRTDNGVNDLRPTWLIRPVQ